MPIIIEHNVDLWARYVDDVVALIDDNDEFEKAKKLRDIINTKHPNIEFTIETEVNKQLPFLDVLILETIMVLVQTFIERKRSLVLILIGTALHLGIIK